MVKIESKKRTTIKDRMVVSTKEGGVTGKGQSEGSGKVLILN